MKGSSSSISQSLLLIPHVLSLEVPDLGANNAFQPELGRLQTAQAARLRSTNTGGLHHYPAHSVLQFCDNFLKYFTKNIVTGERKIIL